MHHVEDGQTNLYAYAGVVVLEVPVVEVVVVVLGEAVVLRGKVDLRPPLVSRVAKRDLAFGPGNGVCRVDCRAIWQGRGGGIGSRRVELRDAV